MNYADIKATDTTNGLGFGVSLYVSGCRNCCKGCFNAETWDFCYGEEFTEKELSLIVDLVSRPYVDFFSVLGGDPMEPENYKQVGVVLDAVKKARPDIKIYLWTGYYFEDIIKNSEIKDLLGSVDVLIDSPFILEQRNIRLHFRGSSNQRVIDCKKSIESGQVILVKDSGLIEINDKV